MKKVYTLLSIFLFISFISFAQNCDYQLDAGEDIVLCANGDIQLNATFSAQPLNILWTPATLFGNPNNLSTSATITEPTTLHLSVSVLSEVNLVNNGDFSQGDTGFTSDYIYGTGGGVGLLSNEGQYAIDDNAGNTHNHFSNCNDHTGGGNMMVVNASGLPNNIWCQTITVETNTSYDFSAWITSVTDENPAELQFSINGNLLGDIFNASSSTCFWQPFAAQWNSDNTTSAEICIVNSNLTPNGNDFALDDIAFQQICEFTDEVIVDINPANANWTSPVLLCEAAAAQLLDDWLAPEATPNGTWTINNVPATHFSPQELGSGLYAITYFADNGNCTAELTQGIVLAAALSAGDGDSISLCQNENQLITLTTLLSNQDAGGTWIETSFPPSTEGAFNAINGTFDTEGQTAGIYAFEYIQNNVEPCLTTSTEVNITIHEIPAAVANVSQILDCTINEVTIGDSNADPSFVYQWFDENSLLIGSSSSLPVSEEGVYLLMVTDPLTHCQNIDEALVETNVSIITVETQSTPISCHSTHDGEININNTSGGTGPYMYAIDGENFFPAQIFTDLEAGSYTITAMDIFGCTGESNIMIESNMTEIIANVQTIPISCNTTNDGQIIINNVSGGTSPYSYSIDGENYVSTPIFSDLEAGDYVMTIMDAMGCSSAESITTLASNNTLEVSISSDAIENPPILSIGDNIDLNLDINVPISEIISVIWTPNEVNCLICTQINVSPSNTTVYEVTVIDDNGCTASADFQILIDKSYSFYIPNAFSPNDDGVNDIFYINSGNKMHHVLQMNIANRWGDIIYENKDFPTNTAMQGWDGKFKGKRLNPGVYIYVAEIKISDENIIKISGEVTLLY